MHQNTSPSSHDLLTFQAICEEKNMTRAAERLGLTQPALTQAIKRLEEQFGVKLLDRGRMGAAPTKAGQELLAGIADLLHEWDKLQRRVQGQNLEMSGQLIFGAHPSVSQYTYPLIFSHIKKSFPDLDLRFKSGLSREITDDVITKNIDIGLVINPTRNPDLVVHDLLVDHVCFWKKKNREKINGPILADLTLLQSQYLLKKARQQLRNDKVIGLNSLETIAQIVLTGEAYGIVPAKVIEGLKLTNELEKIEGMPTYKDQLCIIYHTDNRQVRRVKESVKLIRSTFKG
jgi:LysR family transcriptional regulator, cell division regulator